VRARRAAARDTAAIAAIALAGQVLLGSPRSELALDAGSDLPAYIFPELVPIDPTGSGTAIPTRSVVATPTPRAPAVTASQPAPRPAAPTTATPAQPGQDPIIAYSACETAGTLRLTASYTRTYDWHQVFINTDQDTSTGYWIDGVSNGVGADYLVENEFLYRSTGIGWSWTPAAGDDLPLDRTGGTFSWQVTRIALGAATGTLRVAFGGSSTSAEAFTPVITVGAC
jgi:hypothetical protein